MKGFPVADQALLSGHSAHASRKGALPRAYFHSGRRRVTDARRAGCTVAGGRDMAPRHRARRRAARRVGSGGWRLVSRAGPLPRAARAHAGVTSEGTGVHVGERCECRPRERRMALIEHLEREGWEEFLRDMFRYTLDVLERDRFGSVGSSVDDLRSWLARGGVARVRERLDAQMDARRFPPSRRAAVNDCIEQLVRETPDALFDLTAKGIIPATGQEWFDARGMLADPDSPSLVRLSANAVTESWTGGITHQPRGRFPRDRRDPRGSWCRAAGRVRRQSRR